MESSDTDFDVEDFTINIEEEIVLGQWVGGGAFSSVFIADYFGETVAVKQQKLNEEEQMETYMLRELSILKTVSHPNLIEYVGAARGKSDVWIVTEFMPGGDLTQLLTDKDKELGVKFRIKIAQQAASGLAYLHSKMIIHRDIKSANIILGLDWRCKITDFGFARKTQLENPDEASRMTICGTDDYMAPELMFDEEYGTAADAYSFGLVLMEIWARNPVGAESGFASTSPANNFELDLEGLRAQAPADAPESFVELSLQCCSYDKESRPAMSDVLSWLDDLMAELPEDTVPEPPAPVMPAIEGVHAANQSAPAATREQQGAPEGGPEGKLREVDEICARVRAASDWAGARNGDPSDADGVLAVVELSSRRLTAFEGEGDAPPGLPLDQLDFVRRISALAVERGTLTPEQQEALHRIAEEVLAGDTAPPDTAGPPSAQDEAAAVAAEAAATTPPAEPDSPKHQVVRRQNIANPLLIHHDKTVNDPSVGLSMFGFLYKKMRNWPRNWKLRYFVLAGLELSWWRKVPEDQTGMPNTKPAGRINLENCTCVVMRKDKSVFKFTLIPASSPGGGGGGGTSSGARDATNGLRLSSRDPATAIRWLQAFQVPGLAPDSAKSVLTANKPNVRL